MKIQDIMAVQTTPKKQQKTTFAVRYQVLFDEGDTGCQMASQFFGERDCPVVAVVGLLPGDSSMIFGPGLLDPGIGALIGAAAFLGGSGRVRPPWQQCWQLGAFFFAVGSWQLRSLCLRQS